MSNSSTSSTTTPSVPALQLFSLKGQTALVTGGSRGIGAAIAIALADAGASVCVAQRDPSHTSTADTIRSRGHRAEILSCDMTNREDVKGLFQRALDAMGGEIHILVNCAGLLKRSDSTELSEEDWDAVRATSFSLSRSFFLTITTRSSM